MRVRKGFVSIALQKMKRLELQWVFRQGKKYRDIKRALRRKDGIALCGPIIAHFFCTRQCNLKCPMCDIPNRKVESKEINRTQGFRILDELAELGVSGVSFTGGEPLLRSDIFDFIRHARALDMETILVTNGIKLCELGSEVVAAGPDVVNVSIDGSTSEIHDKSRGVKGAFERTVKGVRTLKRLIVRHGSDMQIVASTVLSQDNVGDLENIIGLCRDIGVSRVIICPLHEFRGDFCKVSPVKAGFDIQNHLLGHKERSFIDNSDRYLSHLNDVLCGEPPPSGCNAGYTTLVIDYEGNVYPCKCDFENSRSLAGPLSENLSVKDVWYSGAFNEFRRKCGLCRRCYLTVNREFDGLFE